MVETVHGPNFASQLSFQRGGDDGGGRVVVAVGRIAVHRQAGRFVDAHPVGMVAENRDAGKRFLRLLLLRMLFRSSIRGTQFSCGESSTDAKK